jgi:hypothetical protein
MKYTYLIVVSLLLASCTATQTKGLYELESSDVVPQINGFTQLSIFKDDLSEEIWYTKNPTCVNVTLTRKDAFEGNGALVIQWNKQAGNCPWLGLGIGWDGWAAKDLSQIYPYAALSFRVMTNQKSMAQLPWAIGFEDFSGSQKWTGATADVVVNGPIGGQWTQVKIPLTKFGMEFGDFDIYSIKQLMFQFESSGEVMIDQVEIVRL